MTVPLHTWELVLHPPVLHFYCIPVLSHLTQDMHSNHYKCKYSLTEITLKHITRQNSYRLIGVLYCKVLKDWLHTKTNCKNFIYPPKNYKIEIICKFNWASCTVTVKYKIFSDFALSYMQKNCEFARGAQLQ